MTMNTKQEKTHHQQHIDDRNEAVSHHSGHDITKPHFQHTEAGRRMEAFGDGHEMPHTPRAKDKEAKKRRREENDSDGVELVHLSSHESHHSHANHHHGPHHADSHRGFIDKAIAGGFSSEKIFAFLKAPFTSTKSGDGENLAQKNGDGQVLDASPVNVASGPQAELNVSATLILPGQDAAFANAPSMGAQFNTVSPEQQVSGYTPTRPTLDNGDLGQKPTQKLAFG